MVSGTQTSGLTTTPKFSQRNQNQQNQQDRQASISNKIWSERIELRGTSPMSFNGTITPSRSPSLASNGSSSSSSLSSSNIPRVHGHDHTRPLPPPRLPDITPTISTIAPLTAPLTPLSTSSSFRSRITPINSLNDNSILSSPTTTTRIINNSNNINNNNNNSNNTNNINNNNNNNSSNSNNSNSNNNNNNNSRTTVGEVTLTVPRPDGERVVNEYVETPFRQPTPLTNQKCSKNDRRLLHHHNNNHHHHQLQQLQNQHHQQQQNLQRQQQQQQPPQQQQQQQQTSNDKRINNTRRNQILLQSSLPNSQPVTKQPVSFTKEPANTIGSSSLGLRLNNDPSLSIMCDYCGKCKCESCREPPPLPSKWLCDNSCFCSAETALDYASCLCCVKGLFYHCADTSIGIGGSSSGNRGSNNNSNSNSSSSNSNSANNDNSDGIGIGDLDIDGSCVDEPCSCSGSRKTTRWACLAALTMVLPCLLCYWPLKGCVTLCETCYAKHAAQGCRCDPSIRHQIANNSSLLVSRDSRDTEKRLLDPVTPEL